MKHASKRHVLIFATLAVAAVLGGLWHRFATQASSLPIASTATPVQAAVTARANVPVYIDALGTVQAFKTATLTTRVDGQLQKLNFTEGSDVEAGELLAQIDPRPYQAQLAQAEAKLAQDRAQLENARENVQRYTVLSPEDYASKQTLDAARSQVAQFTAQIKADQAAIDAAKTQLAYTSIVAPFGGRTGMRQVDEGNIVRASDTGGIVVITQLQPIYVLFTVPQDQLPTLAAAMAAGPVPATVLSSDGKTQLDQGAVTLIDNRIDPATGTVRLRATFSNQNQRLWPGQFVNVRVLADTLRNVLTVPLDSVSQGPHGSFTYVVKSDHSVEMRPLEVGQTAEAVAQIVAGLKDGEQVVTNGQYRLRPGAQVQVRADDTHDAGSSNAIADVREP